MRLFKKTSIDFLGIKWICIGASADGIPLGLAAGNTMSASRAVGVMNISMTTSRSNWPRACRMRAVFG